MRSACCRKQDGAMARKILGLTVARITFPFPSERLLPSWKTMKNLLRPLACLAVAISAGWFAGAGCSSAGEPRDLMSEEVRNERSGDRPVAMKGETDFVGGTVHVVATVARGFDRRPGQKTAAGPKIRHGWFRRDTDAYKEDYDFEYTDDEKRQKEMIEDYMRQAKARRAAGSPMPPVTVHVIFENHGPQAVDVEPTEVSSDLGNFAARPKKLTLAPGESADLEPMVSQLGVTSDEIPLTVSIRVRGKTETQVIPIKNVIVQSLRK